MAALVQEGLSFNAMRRSNLSAVLRLVHYTGSISRKDLTTVEALEEHSDATVSEQQWSELGRLFIEYFEDDEVRHSR